MPTHSDPQSHPKPSGPKPLPPFRRASIHDLVDEVAAGHPDPAVAIGAKALPQVRSIQVGVDEAAGFLADAARADPSYIHPHTLRTAGEVLAANEIHVQVLEHAARAARRMQDEAVASHKALESAMSQQKSDDTSSDFDPPKLTTSGEPHPLQAGDYDADADAQLGAESDIAALKAGHTTHAQAEAIGRADAAEDEAEADVGKAAPKAAPAPKAAAPAPPPGKHEPPKSTKK